MPREASGTIEWRRGKNGVECWHARVSLGPGNRPWVPMPGIPHAAEDAARRQAHAISRRMRQTGAVPEHTGETVNEFFERWIDNRERKGLRIARSDRGRYVKWIAPLIGTRPVAGPDRVNKEELKAIVRRLDEAVARRDISWKTSISAWGVVTKMFDDACRSKLAEFCVRDDNPASTLRGPDRGPERAGPYLFPNEFLKLVTCERVPLHRRQIYAVATYLYLRGGELAALEWPAVNLRLGYVHVHRSLNTDTGKIGPTKTKHNRKVPIEPTLLPLLKAMHDEARGEGFVVEMPSFCEWAAGLRRHLELSGCDREDLYADDATRRQITFHDLRHTGCTWRAIRGDDITKIQRAAGHTEAKMTHRYVNEAEVFDLEAFGQPFPPLPIELTGAVPESSLNRPWIANGREKQASPAGVEGPPSSGRTAANSCEASAEPQPLAPAGDHPGTDAAVKEAVARAVAEGRYELAGRLLDLLKNAGPVAEVVTLRNRSKLP